MHCRHHTRRLVTCSLSPRCWRYARRSQTLLLLQIINQSVNLVLVIRLLGRPPRERLSNQRGLSIRDVLIQVGERRSAACAFRVRHTRRPYDILFNVAQVAPTKVEDAPYNRIKMIDQCRRLLMALFCERCNM